MIMSSNTKPTEDFPSTQESEEDNTIPSDLEDDDSNLESDDDQDFFDFGDTEEEMDSTSGGGRMHPVLAKDLEIMTKTLPPDLFSSREFPDIHEIDVDFGVPTCSLDANVLAAWGLKQLEPLTIRISLDTSTYMDRDNVNKVEVFQKGLQANKGSLEQMRHIVAEFCRVQFRQLTNKDVEAARGASNLPVVDKRTPLKTANPEMSHHKLSDDDRAYLDIIGFDKTLPELMDMGFEENEIQTACLATDGSKENTLEYLLAMKNESPDRQASSTVSTIQSLTTVDDPKVIPSLDQGFLMQLYNYIMQRFPTLSDYCPICDKHHNFSMLKSVVCSDPLCLFANQTLGVLTDVTDCISFHPKVANLLICLTKAASISCRAELILTPFPCIVSPKAGSELPLHEEKKDLVLLRYILSKFPPMSKIAECADLKAFLDSAHVLCFPLLRWIISSNRCHIVALPHSKFLQFMETPHQYLMLNSAPAKEKRFREYKKKHGSTFAFHGSPIENWHAIIRQGLIVASGTKKQINGAAYGEGIYLTPELKTASHYTAHLRGSVKPSKKQSSETRTPEIQENDETHIRYILGDSSDLSCVALCEVIKKESNLKGLKKHDSIWVCNNSDFVCTRFLFVFDSRHKNQLSSTSVHTESASVQKEILTSLESTFV